MPFADNAKPFGLIEIEEECERFKQNNGLQNEKLNLNIDKKISNVVGSDTHFLYTP